MSASKKPPEELEHPVIRTEEDLEEHDPLEPAYLLISGVLLQGVYTLEHGRTMQNDTGELLRGIESLLVGIGEPNSSCMVKGLNQAVACMNRLIATAQVMREELLPKLPRKRRKNRRDDDDPGGTLH